MNKLIIALAVASTVSAAPLSTVDKCQDDYKSCIAAGTPEVACSCTLTACAGEDSARIREWCSSATASLVEPTKTEIPGGCNPAHPGSCPSSYFTNKYTAPAETFTSIPGIPGGCNPAHPGSCPSSYFTKTYTAPAQTFTSISGIPGGCNPAHPGSCPSSYFTYPVASKTAVQPAPVPAPTEDCSEGTKPDGTSSEGTTYPEPKPVEGETWTIKDLTRYCGEGNEGCDYNFEIAGADGKTEKCTIIRMPGKDAATESWSNEPCTDGSELTVSWGYVTEPAPAFAVVSVVKGNDIAWFGVPNVIGQKATPTNPFGSGEFGDLGPEQVYTY
ncbi:uncharacterized protein FPRO_10085 [Fusarium proliferatum ET1]|uniref:Extracellular membrane protein CFEM domain-containing protein n=1 Tax=Fusarium proliferatum (strain ET1) TaxID=1227346 RepID=A0A1L7VQV9_FUSPR|nr:uncharacterized protein FPRO_10085 [Fusarium proliferatum ET1]CZR42782.1 uncharacterized protein FPRO_10085 [Fusarium proliferatum ET1]